MRGHLAIELRLVRRIEEIATHSVAHLHHRETDLGRLLGDHVVAIDHVLELRDRALEHRHDGEGRARAEQQHGKETDHELAADTELHDVTCTNASAPSARSMLRSMTNL